MEIMQTPPANPQVVRSILDAIKREDCSDILRLLDSNPDQKHWHTPIGGATWLGYAAGEGKIKAVKTLLLAGVDVDQGSDKDNIAPICNATGNGFFDIVEYLIECGAKLNTSTSISNPLMWAVTDWRHADDTSIVSLLLKAGIDSTVAYPYSGRTKTKQPLDATAKSLLWGTPAKAGTIAAWNAQGDEQRIRQLLEHAMTAADTHQTKYAYSSKKIAEMKNKRVNSFKRAVEVALIADFR